jgi:hypothetical protein
LNGHGRGGADTPGQRGRRAWITAAVATGLAVLVPLAESYLVLNTWIICDIGGINAGVSTMTVIFFLLPALLIGHAAVLGLLYWAGARLSRSTRWPPLATVILFVTATVVGALLVARFVATPAEPSLTCPTGVPEWWPSWLPHGSFGLY